MNTYMLEARDFIFELMGEILASLAVAATVAVDECASATFSGSLSPQQHSSTVDSVPAQLASAPLETVLLRMKARRGARFGDDEESEKKAPILLR